MLMILTDLTRAVLITLGGRLPVPRHPAGPVFVLATVASLLGTPFLVAQRSLLPQPGEPTRGAHRRQRHRQHHRVTRRSSSARPSPLCCSAFTSVQVVFLLNVATFLWSMAAGVGASRPAEPASRRDGRGRRGRTPQPSFLPRPRPGSATSRRHAGLRLVTVAHLRTDGDRRGLGRLRAGDGGHDPRDRARGAWATSTSVAGRRARSLGGVLAISRASRRPAGQRPRGRRAALVAAAGAGRRLALAGRAASSRWRCWGWATRWWTSTSTRSSSGSRPDAVLGRVFGALEACFIATMALGALVMPFLIEGWGCVALLVARRAPWSSRLACS